jgi:hypothetical protein
MIDDPELTEGRFDATAFDHALFREDPAAWVEMQWVEREPAAFDVVVQRPFVIEPKRLRDDFILAGATRPPHQEVAADLTATVMQLRAAGVRAGVRFAPFREEQRQITRFRFDQIVLPPETASAGEDGGFGTGARFGESPLGQGRFN